MRYASGVHAPRVLILGAQELERGVVTVRDMTSAEQSEVPEDGVAQALAQ